jgi:beta-glucanase (GH16 family)
VTYYNYLGQPMPESATETGHINGTSAGNETIVAPAGDTSVAGNGGGDVLVGSSGDNRFWITDPKDVIQEAPNAGIDTEIGWMSLKLADNVENLTVYDGFNYALGNSLNNLIVVDDSIHWLDGGAGDDVLVGAATARDTFVAKYGQGNDVIYNWNGNSQLQLLGTNLNTTAQIRAAMTQQGSDIVLAMGGGETLTIRNATISNIADRQFLTPLDTSKLGAVTFDDEFNSLSLWDPNTRTGTWQTNLGGNPKDQWAYTLVSNGETEAYVAPGYQGRGEQDIGVNPFSVNNGVVTITAAPVSSEDAYATWNRDYTSGMLNTLGSFSQKYGYFEMRAELPNVAGTWPAFWLMPSPYQANAEADIMEALGATPTVDYRRAFGGDNGTESQSDNVLREDPTGFHTYGMLWTPTTVTFYYDGVAVLTGATPSTWTSPMGMIINMATGGWGGAADASQFPADMNIDYVRAYALADGSTQVVTGTPTVQVATLNDDGAASGKTNMVMAFDDGSGPVTSAHIGVYDAKPTTLPAGKTFVIYEDSGAIFGAVSDGTKLAAPTALIAGDNVHIFTGAGTWLTEGKVVFAYTQPNASGGTDVWDMVFDTAKLTFVRQDLGAGTGQDIHFVATGDGGFAVSWEAPDHTISARGYDEYAYGGDIPGWYGPVRTITGDLTGVDANGHVIATATDGSQHLYSLNNPSIDTSGNTAAPTAVTPSVALSTPSVAHAEGASGDTAFSYVVTRSGDTTTAVTVNYAVAGSGTNAANAADFHGGVLPTGTLSFAAGETSKTIVVNVAGDTTVETDETFTLTLSGPSGATLGTATAAGTITNDDTASTGGGDTTSGQVVNSSGYGATLNGGSGNDTLNAGQGPDVLTGGAGADSFAFQNLPWNAGHVTDFTVGTDKLDLSALMSASGYTGSNPITDHYVTLQSDGSGGTKVYYDTDGAASGNTIQYLITDLDHVATSGLTWAQLSGGAASTGGGTTGGGTTTPPASPTVALTTTSVTHAEGASGDTAFSYVVTRSGDTSATSTVSWAVAGSGTNAANAADFHGGVLPTGTLSFAAGETSKTIVVNVAGDATVESDETFTLTLSGPSGATLGSATATGTITNDDTATTGGGSTTSGQVVNSSGYGATLTGGSGNDTLNAGQGPDVLTGGAGADSFAFKNLPWNAGHVTDFTVGTDKLDLSALFSASGYTGADPIADHYVTLQSDGAGGTKVYYDTDGAASGNTIQYVVTDLDQVATTGLTWAQLSTGGSSSTGASAPTGGGAPPGQVVNSSGYGATLTGGAGADTLNAGQGPDVLTGGGGADHFVYNNLPWNPGHITDFTPGTDVLDLRPLFAAAGYTGTNPIADHVLTFQADGSGNTQVMFDPDGPGGNWPTTITTLDHITPAQVGSGDFLFH